jgi:uncharacterized protein with GYD domain
MPGAYSERMLVRKGGVMAAYLLFGKMNPEAARAVSAQRTRDAIALIKKYGGEYKAGYALLGDIDYVVILDLPDTERAMQVSLGLSKLLGISFRTAPAVTMDEFDRLAAV